MKKMIKEIAIKLVSILLFPISYVVRKELGLIEAKRNFDLRATLQRLANEESAQYISENMKTIESVDSPFALIGKSLKSSTVKGLTLEFGVFSGKSINYIAKLIDGPVYGFDSFEGLPELWRDGFGKGAFKLKRLPNVRGNVHLIKGWFNETIPRFTENFDSNVKFLHIDCDLYSSTKVIFDLLGDKIIPGTIIVFDEYFNYPGWKNGEFKAFKEFISLKKLNYEYIGYNRNHEQVAVVILASE